MLLNFGENSARVVSPPCDVFFFFGGVNAPGLRIPALCPFCPLFPPLFGSRVRGQNKLWRKVSGRVRSTHRAHWSQIQEAGPSEGRGQRAAEGRGAQKSFHVCAHGDDSGSTSGVCGEGRVIPGRSARLAPFKAILARLAPTLVSAKRSAKCQQISSTHILPTQSPRVAACSPSAGFILVFILFILYDHSLNHL